MWAPEAPALEIPGIELLDDLGQGGMGVVYRARQTRLERLVAVKLLSPELCSAASFRARFEREAKLLARINHPNIVAVYDWGEVDDTLYLVMELVVGRPLSAALPVSASAAIDIGVALCDALAHAHQVGVVHCDLKPANVLIDRDGRVKLADFGIARMTDGDTGGQGTAGGVIGTPYFIAPEVLAGAKADARADLYALGVLLYQAITGSYPMGAFEPLEGPLDEVVRGLLSPRPDRRPPSAEAARAQLEAARTASVTVEASTRPLRPSARSGPEAGREHDANDRGPALAPAGRGAGWLGLAAVAAVLALVAWGAWGAVGAAVDEPGVGAVATASGVEPGVGAVAAASGSEPVAAPHEAVAGEPAEASADAATPDPGDSVPGDRRAGADRRAADEDAAESAGGQGAASARSSRRAHSLRGRGARRGAVVAAPDQSSSATLVVRVLPWARVLVGGALVGRAEPPVTRFSLAPGVHEVVLENPITGTRLVRSVTLEADESVTIRADLSAKLPP